MAGTAPVGGLGFCTVGIEGTAGTPVNGQVELDLTSESLRGTGPTIKLPTINRTRMIKKVVGGPYAIAGDLNFNVTPDKVTKLIYAALTSLGTTGGGPYVHTFKTGATIKPLTVQIMRPQTTQDEYFIYPGCYVNRLTFTAPIGEVLRGTATLVSRGIEQVDHAEHSDGGIAASALSPFVFHEGAVTLQDGANTDVSNLEFTIDTGAQIYTGFGAAGRAPNRVEAGLSQITGSFTMCFDSMGQHSLWMGNASVAYPLLTLDYPLANTTTFTMTSGVSIMQITVSNAYYDTSEPAITGPEGVVLQTVGFQGTYNTGTTSDIQVIVTNAETEATITTTGTNAVIS